MGCKNSKLDGVPAVALCRERCNFLQQALRQSYGVAHAHLSHMHSLHTIGPALSRFFLHFQTHCNTHTVDNQSPLRYHSSPSPPPSPPPPTSSSWDFFNVFETFHKHQLPCTPTPHHNHNKTKALSDAIQEIHTLFQRASRSGNSPFEMLDAATLRYHPPNIPLSPATHLKMNLAFTPSNPLKCMESSIKYQGVVTDKPLTRPNLSSTLSKLSVWEKKLYLEVKAGEKFRVLHEKKCRQLRLMNKKGGDALKIHSLETLIEILYTKITMSFQVVDNISSTVHKLMEGELWPQINKFIFRFLEMWKEMVECYRGQYKEIAEAKRVDGSWLNSFGFSGKASNCDVEELIKLKCEVQKWNLSFSDWIYAQRALVKALNGWLVRCLPYEAEDIVDATPPFSPAKMGAPPVFVICTKWSRAMDILSEKDVTEAFNGFMLQLNEFLEKHISDLQQKLKLDKELERKVKMLEREEQKMHKVVQGRERKTSPIGRENKDRLLRGDHGEHVDIMSLQSGLEDIFAAMESFTATMACVYEELCQQIEEGSHV